MSQQDPSRPQDPTQPGSLPGWHGKPKKPFFRRTWVIVSTVIVGFLVIIGAVNAGGEPVALVTTPVIPTTSAPAKQKPGRTVAPTEAPAACTGSRNDPCTVKPGVAFTIGKHRLNKGWKLVYDQYVGTKIVGQVTNVSDDTSTAFFNVKFLKDMTVIASFDCYTEELEPHYVQQIQCSNGVTTTKRVTGWTKVTAEATF